MYGTLKLHILRHIDEKTILCKHCIQGCYSISLSIGKTTIILCNQVRTLSCYTVQTVNDDTIIKLCLWKSLTVELIINYEIKRSAEIWNIALEGIIRINRNLKTVEIQSIIRFKELLHIRVLIAFHLLGRKALSTEVFKSLIAYLIEHRCSMLFDELLRLCIEVYILFFALHCNFFLEVLSKG